MDTWDKFLENSEKIDEKLKKSSNEYIKKLNTQYKSRLNILEDLADNLMKLSNIYITKDNLPTTPKSGDTPSSQDIRHEKGETPTESPQQTTNKIDTKPAKSAKTPQPSKLDKQNIKEEQIEVVSVTAEPQTQINSQFDVERPKEDAAEEKSNFRQKSIDNIVEKIVAELKREASFIPPNNAHLLDSLLGNEFAQKVANRINKNEPYDANLANDFRISHSLTLFEDVTPVFFEVKDDKIKICEGVPDYLTKKSESCEISKPNDPPKFNIPSYQQQEPYEMNKPTFNLPPSHKSEATSMAQPTPSQLWNQSFLPNLQTSTCLSPNQSTSTNPIMTAQSSASEKISFSNPSMTWPTPTVQPNTPPAQTSLSNPTMTWPSLIGQSSTATQSTLTNPILTWVNQGVQSTTSLPQSTPSTLTVPWGTQSNSSQPQTSLPNPTVPWGTQGSKTSTLNTQTSLPMMNWQTPTAQSSPQTNFSNPMWSTQSGATNVQSSFSNPLTWPTQSGTSNPQSGFFNSTMNCPPQNVQSNPNFCLFDHIKSQTMAPSSQNLFGYSHEKTDFDRSLPREITGIGMNPFPDGNYANWNQPQSSQPAQRFDHFSSNYGTNQSFQKFDWSTGSQTSMAGVCQPPPRMGTMTSPGQRYTQPPVFSSMAKTFFMDSENKFNKYAVGEIQLCSENSRLFIKMHDDAGGLKIYIPVTREFFINKKDNNAVTWRSGAPDRIPMMEACFAVRFSDTYPRDRFFHSIRNFMSGI